MALRSILSWISPFLTQVGASDTVLAYGANMTKQNNANASPIVIGSAVYAPSAGNVNLARANAIGTSDVVGLVADASITNGTTGNIQTTGIITATTTQWDAVVTGESGALRPAASITLILQQQALSLRRLRPQLDKRLFALVWLCLQHNLIWISINRSFFEGELWPLVPRW